MHAAIRPPHLLFFLFRILLSVPNTICFSPLGEGNLKVTFENGSMCMVCLKPRW